MSYSGNSLPCWAIYKISTNDTCLAVRITAEKGRPAFDTVDKDAVVVWDEVLLACYLLVARWLRAAYWNWTILVPVA